MFVIYKGDWNKFKKGLNAAINNGLFGNIYNLVRYAIMFNINIITDYLSGLKFWNIPDSDSDDYCKMSILDVLFGSACYKDKSVRMAMEFYNRLVSPMLTSNKGISYYIGIAYNYMSSTMFIYLSRKYGHRFNLEEFIDGAVNSDFEGWDVLGYDHPPSFTRLMMSVFPNLYSCHKPYTKRKFLIFVGRHIDDKHFDHISPLLKHPLFDLSVDVDFIIECVYEIYTSRKMYDVLSKNKIFSYRVAEIIANDTAGNYGCNKTMILDYYKEF
jgi:hypothetical protein